MESSLLFSVAPAGFRPASEIRERKSFLGFFPTSNSIPWQPLKWIRAVSSHLPQVTTKIRSAQSKKDESLLPKRNSEGSFSKVVTSSYMRSENIFLRIWKDKLKETLLQTCSLADIFGRSSKK